MLFKLLKYDLRAIYKYWWPCALLSLVLSIVGGISYHVLSIELVMISDIDPFLTVMLSLSASIGLMVSVVGLSAFLLATEIFIFIRFYKHFFSDEGYLTFTLPVKRTSLLHSKIISAFMLHLSTIAVILIGICLFVILGVPMTDLRIMWQTFYADFGTILETVGLFNLLMLILEFLAACIVTIFFSYLSIFVCITFGSIIVKRGKVFAAIGIYYLLNGLLSGLSQILGIFSFSFLPGILIVMSGFELGVTLWMVLLPILILYTAVTVGIYALELYLIDRKLNLS